MHVAKSAKCLINYNFLTMVYRLDEQSVGESQSECTSEYCQCLVEGSTPYQPSDKLQ